MLSKPEEGTTRQRLLDVALELFAQHGFAGTSVRMVCRAAGLRESSMYNHFTGKEELYDAVIGQWGPTEFVDRLKSAEYKSIDDPKTFFRLCARHLIDRWVDPREHLYFAAISKEGPGGPGQKKFSEALYREELDLLGEYCARFAKTTGMIAPDPRETARMFAAGMSVIRAEHFAFANATPPRSAVEKAVNGYLDNLLAVLCR